MATAIAIVGPSGSGKTASLRNLPADETVIISPYKSDLSFRPAHGKYAKHHYLPGEPIPEEANFLLLPKKEGKYQVKLIPRLIRQMANREHVRYLMLEDVTHWMHDYTNDSSFVAQENSASKWSRWADFGRDMFTALFTATKNLRPDLWIGFIFHVDVDQYGKHNIRTAGQMLDKKIEIPSYFNYVFYTKVDPYDATDADKERYFFATNDDGFRPAKTPLGMFPEMYIPNDLMQVIERIQSYRRDTIRTLDPSPLPTSPA